MKSWYDKARAVIADVHASLPKDATLADRKKALHAAYPFGQRQYHPYKQWCKAQREYLALFGGGKPKAAPPMDEGLFAVGLLEQKGIAA